MQLSDNFSSYDLVCKFFERDKEYASLTEEVIHFDSTILELKDIYNIELINEEINKIQRKIFMFGVVLESQAQVLQLLTDEYDRWHAEKYLVITPEAEKLKKNPTETLKESILLTTYASEYDVYKSRLRTEQYKYNLLKRTVAALEGFSYRLHDLQTYRASAMNKGL